jgi:hypothetical protein
VFAVIFFYGNGVFLFFYLCFQVAVFVAPQYCMDNTGDGDEDEEDDEIWKS